MALQYADRARSVAAEYSDDENLARVLQLKSRIYRDIGEFDKALAIADSALALPDSSVTSVIRARIYNEAGSIYRRKGESSKSLESHLFALKILEITDAKPDLAVTYNFLGIIHDIIGNYDKALSFHLESLKIREELNDRRGVVSSTTNIGTLHQRIEQYDDALRFYEQSLPIWKELDQKNALASILNNMGAVYELTGQYQKAHDYYREAYEILSDLENLYSLVIALENLGTIHLYLGEPEKALEYNYNTLDIRKKLEDTRGLSHTYLNMATIFLRISEPDSALNAAQKSLTYAKKTNSWRLIRNAHEILATLFEENGNYGESLKHYKLFKAAKDTLFNSDSQTIISELQEQYRTKEQQQQIDRLLHEKEVRNLWFVILIGGFILALIVSGLLHNRYMLKVRSQRIRVMLHRSEMEKARLQASNAETQARLLKSENKRKTEELEKARKLQLSMLPAHLPNNENVAILAHMETATEVGGDYYDLHVADNGDLTLCIGDATGHGTAAGTLVTAVKSLFNLMAGEEDPVDIIRRCSISVKNLNLPQLYMAFALMRLKENRLELVGAGMPPALIYRAESGTVEAVNLKGMPLGSIPEYPYVKEIVELNDDDVVLFLTDGFPELANAEGNTIGYNLPEKLLEKYGHKEPSRILEHFKRTVTEWIGQERPNDDITFLLLKKKPVPQLSTVVLSG